MSLQLILGNSGSGKSYELYNKVIEASIADPKGHFIVIVPEQFTMQTQKELVSLHPRKGILNIDVLSFQRLAYRIFEELGSDKRTVLEETGKNLLLCKVAIEKKDELQVLGAHLNKLGYITQMKSMISELTQYDVTMDKMDQMIAAAGEKKQLYYKLQDVGILYAGFREKLQGQYITAEEVLEALCQVADRSEILKGSVLALDGFTGFTPIQQKLLERLMVLAKRVMVTITMDANENPFKIYGEHELFYLSKKTIRSLTKIAKEKHVEISDPVLLGKGQVYRFKDTPVLGFLEQNLFRRRRGKYEFPIDEISIHNAKNPTEEANFVARTIKQLTGAGYRYQDIAVITGDMAAYSSYFRKVFEACRIPCFIDETKTILLNPFIEFIRAALELVQKNYSYESVFRLMRTGLCDVSREETDLLENYILAAGVRGYGKWQKPFEKVTQRNDEQVLEQCNEIRAALMEKLVPFTKVLKNKNATVAKCTAALYEFIVSCDIQRKLTIYEEEFKEQNRLDMAKEYSQIYGIVMNLLDKLVELLGEECLSLKDFAQILDAGFEEAKVGIIPPAVDQVVVGDIERTRLKAIKALFFVGLNDGWVPKAGGTGGILSDLERNALELSGVELAPTARENMYTQKFYLYLNLTKPSSRLYLSYSKVDSDGKTLRPSYVLHDMARLFPAVPQKDEDLYDSMLDRVASPGSGIPYLIEGLRNIREGRPMPVDEWMVMFDWYNQNENYRKKIEGLVDAAFYKRKDEGLPKAVASSLYGSVLENSVTRLERFAACAFSHFLMYGLDLKERETYLFRPMDMGNIFHRVIELFSKKVEHSQYNWFSLPEEIRDSMIEETVEEVSSEYGAKILYSSARNEYAIERMKRIMRRTVWALHEQIKAGTFVPSNYEVSFSMVEDLEAVNIALTEEDKMKLRGRIDRTDVKVEEDEVFVKVIDYKSGNTSFDLVALYYGLQLQLVVYLNAAMELEQRIYPDKEIVPAGIFYYNMQDPMLDREGGDTQEIINQKILKKLRLDGLVNDRREIIENLDTQIGKDSSVIPVSYNKDGSPSKASSIASREQFGQISKFVNDKITEIGKQIVDGHMEALPYERKDKTACDYCIYREICGFDVRIPGTRYNRLKEYKPDEIWKKISGQTQAEAESEER